MSMIIPGVGGLAPVILPGASLAGNPSNNSVAGVTAPASPAGSVPFPGSFIGVPMGSPTTLPGSLPAGGLGLLGGGLGLGGLGLLGGAGAAGLGGMATSLPTDVLI